MLSNIDELGIKEKKFAIYVIENYKDIEKTSIREISDTLEISQPTIVRTCKKLGYSGIKELKLNIVRSNFENKEDVLLDKNVEIDRFFSKICQSLKDTFEVLDLSELKAACVKIVDANYVSIFAVGGSVPIAFFLKHQLMKLGIHSDVYMQDDFNLLNSYVNKKNDVVLGISSSGETELIVKALEMAHKKGVQTICMSKFKKSSILKWADYKIYTCANYFEESTDRSLERIAQMAVVDIMYYAMKRYKLDLEGKA